MKTGRNSRISDLGRFFESVAHSGRSCRSFDMRKAGKQEQPHEAMTRLGSNVVLAKFRGFVFQRQLSSLLFSWFPYLIS